MKMSNSCAAPALGNLKISAECHFNSTLGRKVAYQFLHLEMFQANVHQRGAGVVVLLVACLPNTWFLVRPTVWHLPQMSSTIPSG